MTNWIATVHRGRFSLPPVWFRPAPFVPECDPADDDSVAAAITALLRFDRYVARDYSPGHSSLVVIDETIWHRIKGRFRWVPKERIGAPLQPSTDLLVEQAGTTKEFLTTSFHRTLPGMRNSVSDVWKRPIVPVFVRAVELAKGRLTESVSSNQNAWWYAVQQAAREWISAEWPEEMKLLDGVPPTQRRYQSVYAVRERLAANYRKAGCPKTADYKSLVTLLRHLERIGVFKMGRKKRYVWGNVWKSGLTPGVAEV
jgi:hypothetical protein